LSTTGHRKGVRGKKFQKKIRGHLSLWHSEKNGGEKVEKDRLGYLGGGGREDHGKLPTFLSGCPTG